MKTVLFLIREDKISVRRYLLVAQQLKRLNINSCFLNLTDHHDIVEETIKTLNLPKFPEYMTYNYKSTSMVDKLYLLGTKIRNKIRRKIKTIKQKKAADFQPQSGQKSMEKLLQQLDFDTDIIVKQFCEINIDWWDFCVKLARRHLRRIKPDCVVYDLEMHDTIRQFLFAAKSKRISVFSMQHGEGFAESYSNFPRLADYYIAYSPYSVEKIKTLGVEDENIFLTGVPDTDVIYNYDVTKIKKEIQSEYDLRFDRKIILAALRPAKNKSLDDINIALINTITRVLGNNKKFDILIKCHNVDYICGDPSSYNNEEYENCEIIDSDYPFSKLLKISDYLVTHMSSCIVEAILMDVPTIVIEFHDGGTWPDWNTYKVFNGIPTSELERVLTEIKNDQYSFNTTKESREKFVERFRYKYDNKSAKRIAKAIDCFTDKKTVRVVGKE